VSRKVRSESYLTSGALILFNAASFYELLAPTQPNLKGIRQKYANIGTWIGALRAAFDEAYRINYGVAFRYAIGVLDALPPSPATEEALRGIYEAAQYIVSHKGLLRHDLAGRIYHSSPGRELAKAYATYYTGIPAAELLAWLAIDRWDDSVADFACGSGTLLVAAYHRKMMLAYLDPRQGGGYAGTVEQLHGDFIENQIWGLDAMAFASHLTLVNLALQQPAVTFRKSHIYHVLCGGSGISARLGSLDLLRNTKLKVFERIDRGQVGPTAQGLNEAEIIDVDVPRESSHVILMNPPFTKKDRATRVLDARELKRAIAAVNPDFSTVTGLAGPFVQLADLCLASDGRIGLVLPSAALSGGTWQPIRDLIGEKYHVEQLIISWAPGRPSFSESTALREVLLVARKCPKSEPAGPKTVQHTIVTHIDTSLGFLEARQIAEHLRTILLNPVPHSIVLGSPHPVMTGVRPLGESFSVPKGVLDMTASNWYRLLAFRDSDLAKTALHNLGILPSPSPALDLRFTSVLTEFRDIGQVNLFVKNVEAAGLRILDKTQRGATPALMTSDYGRMDITESDCQWLVRDPSLQVREPFTVRTGQLLVTMRVDAFNTMKVTSAAGKTQITGSVWFPIETPHLRTSDKRDLTEQQVARMCALWLNSTFGLMLLLAEREETRGAWMQWKTQQMRQLKVLDPRALSSDQAARILGLWERFEGKQWDRVHKQLGDAVSDPRHPRRLLDETIASVVLGSVPGIEQTLMRLYTKLQHDLGLLGQVMSGRRL
jgi:hypothetical protein